LLVDGKPGLITTLAVSGYRSLRDLVVPLGQLTLVTGANGSGKTSLYRSLRLLAEAAQGRLVAALAGEGGLSSALWAGPEAFGRSVRAGLHPVQGTARKGPVRLRLGFSGDEYGYAIDLGLPTPPHPFPLDPATKLEAMWTGGLLGRANVFAERRGPMSGCAAHGKEPGVTWPWTCRPSTRWSPTAPTRRTAQSFSPCGSGCETGASTTRCAPTRTRRPGAHR
jgi:predicted ATPase